MLDLADKVLTPEVIRLAEQHRVRAEQLREDPILAGILDIFEFYENNKPGTFTRVRTPYSECPYKIDGLEHRITPHLDLIRLLPWQNHPFPIGLKIMSAVIIPAPIDSDVKSTHIIVDYSPRDFKGREVASRFMYPFDKDRTAFSFDTVFPRLAIFT